MTSKALNKRSSVGLGAHETKRLDEIRIELHEHVLAAEQAHQTAIGHALHVGELLNEAHAIVPRGSWGRWVAANFAGSQTVAATYMRLAERRLELADARTITAAIAQIAPTAQSRAIDERNHESDPLAGYRLASSAVARALVHAGDWTPDSDVPPGYLPVTEFRVRVERLLEIARRWEDSTRAPSRPGRARRGGAPKG